MWKKRSGYLFILPKLTLFSIFVLIPIIWSLFVSFQEYRIFGTEWVGLQNFREVFQDDLFWIAVGNTLRYAVVVMPASVIIALVIAMVWRWIFQTRYGLANYFLSLVGLGPVNWLHSSAWALKSVIIMAVLTPPGVGIILYLAAMGSIPEDLYEAAKIDGANRFLQWWKITLPLLKPATLYLMIVSTIGAFQVFDQVMLMTQGGLGYATTIIVQCGV